MAYTYAKGRNGNIAGIVSTGTGTIIQLKSMRFRARAERMLHDVSGFGDGGNMFWDEGVGQWSFQGAGVVLTGTSVVGYTGLMGTNSIYGTIFLQADSGRTITGTARIHVLDESVNYVGGPVTLTFEGRGDGGANET